MICHLRIPIPGIWQKPAELDRTPRECLQEYFTTYISSDIWLRERKRKTYVYLGDPYIRVLTWFVRVSDDPDEEGPFLVFYDNQPPAPDAAASPILPFYKT